MSKSHWNYRVVKFDTDEGGGKQTFFEIREVHYTNDIPHSHGAASVCGESIEELKEVIAKMIAATTKPVLTFALTIDGARIAEVIKNHQQSNS